ncbi:MAG: hypothetical protein M3T56_05070 [Chloroflexota bacterium]|nr:hypothetical protein [Chloroflexota bacterium]
MQLRAVGIVAILLTFGVEVDPVVPPTPRVNPPPFVCVPPWASAAASTVYLPNITRRLGGPDGFYTPFIIQNAGTVATEIEVTFYMFKDGACAEQYRVPNLAPGAAHSNNPNDEVRNPWLPNDAQFSVVVRSFAAPIVGVVNEHQGAGDRAEALSYNGFNAGAKTVYLPNITRKFFGLYDTPFIIQNLSGLPASVTATFRPFDGIGPTIVIPRSIEPLRAKPIDPDSDDPLLGAPGLADNKQYAVTVTSDQDIGVVVNTQADKAGIEHPLAFATNGITTGGEALYGPYAIKTVGEPGANSSIIVQNLGAAAASPKITFTPLLNHPGGANTYTFPAIQPGSSKAFDPRFSFSTQGTTNVVCGTGNADCLANGTYSFKIEAPGGKIAAQVNSSTAISGTGYSTSASPATKLYAPNVPKGLCFCPVPNLTAGWTGTIYLQPVTATSATLRWYTVPDGALAYTETVPLDNPTSGRIVNGWFKNALPPDRQYSVVIEATGGTIAAIVSQYAPGADNTAIYETFAAP